MRKPLELTIFEKEPGRYGREPRYNSPDGFWAYPASHVDGYAANKHLTDAELAAEVWHACDDRSINASNILNGQYDNPHAQRAFQRAIDQANTLHRFATLPHYDEVHP